MGEEEEEAGVEVVSSWFRALFPVVLSPSFFSGEAAGVLGRVEQA